MEGAGGGSAKGTARVDALRGQIKLAYVIAGALSVPVAILAGAAWYIGGFGVGAGGDVNGISVGGLGVGAGGKLRGIGLGGLGVAAGTEAVGLLVGGVGVGVGGDLRGIALGGIGVGVGGQAQGLLVGGVGVGGCHGRRPRCGASDSPDSQNSEPLKATYVPISESAASTRLFSFESASTIASTSGCTAKEFPLWPNSQITFLRC